MTSKSINFGVFSEDIFFFIGGSPLKYSDKMYIECYKEKNYDFLIINLKNRPSPLNNDYFTPEIILHIHHLGLPIKDIKKLNKYDKFLECLNIEKNVIETELNKYIINDISTTIITYIYE